ncbi:MAG TPA: response regulator [Verrucomicrobiae bacterium]|nr:response regulator [Verrucomicrobiae bacterium]
MGKKILFVDDEPEWRMTVEVWLKDMQYEVLLASDASEAMTKAEGEKLGLIILDLNLAGEKGISLVKYLRRNHPEVPILLYTGLQHDDFQITKMLEQGAHQYLQKGSREELINAVKRSFR